MSVLFADLVGFTSLSQTRDPEEVRELLSRYFETCSSLVQLYGGVVEKFIGDAVMAVWGAPVAQEDDAERAVRTALEVVDAVHALGSEVGLPDLAARAGVLTGEAAVNLAARGQGLVAGDLVNTASRIQSVAEPGTVLVGDSTRRATEAAISYSEGGTHLLKGKTEPLTLHRALRVVAGVGGRMKSGGLEPPFVGREREHKLLKDLFHAAADGGRAHLVQVTGIGGIGKSRLVWEFFKYMDGLSSAYFWHRGRCLAYGEGVTYWALAEMVRGRAEILEGEERSSAGEKLRIALEKYLPDPDDRRFVEPRLAQLIGLEERTFAGREELFSAWRLFFERLTEQDPVVMVFEDMQWADPSLLEFLGHLLDRSRNHPLFVVTLARPDSPAAAFPVGQRNATSIFLEPLADADMRSLLAGFVPGLPGDLTAQILERAEGVPLYAVETVRMLLDRGLLLQEGPIYRPVGIISSLEVPETLHALIASRLDGLVGEERRVIQDAAVLGKTFTKEAVSRLSGIADDLLSPVLASLVAKEFLTVQSDPRSSERGQYGFLQDLVRTVAYETLSKHDRRSKHLEAADYLEEAWGSTEEEIVEVVASHLLQAYQLDERAENAPEIRQRAKEMLVAAGDRAASLAAAREAERYFDEAAALAESPLERAELTERAGQMAELQGRLEEATNSFQLAHDLFSEVGQAHPAARCEARLAGVSYDRGHIDDAIRQLSHARAAMGDSPPNPDLAWVASQLGRMLVVTRRDNEALPLIEEALTLGEHLQLPAVFAEALNNRAIFLTYAGRLDEADTLLRRALDVSLEHDLSAAGLRSYNNLTVVLEARDKYEEAVEFVAQARDLARRAGDRTGELNFVLGSLGDLYALGRWDEALDLLSELESLGELESHQWLSLMRVDAVPVLVHRGRLAEAAQLCDELAVGGTAEHKEHRIDYLSIRALVLLAQERAEEALEVGQEAVSARSELSLHNLPVKRGLVTALEAALSLGDEAKAEELLGVVESAPPGEVSPWLQAQAARLSAKLEILRGNEEVGASFRAAEAAFRRLSTVFDLAVALTEHAEWLASKGRVEEASPLAREAKEVFEDLAAGPWLERLDALDRTMTADVSAGVQANER